MNKFTITELCSMCGVSLYTISKTREECLKPFTAEDLSPKYCTKCNNKLFNKEDVKPTQETK